MTENDKPADGVERSGPSDGPDPWCTWCDFEPPDGELSFRIAGEDDRRWPPAFCSLQCAARWGNAAQQDRIYHVDRGDELRTDGGKPADGVAQLERRRWDGDLDALAYETEDFDGAESIVLHYEDHDGRECAIHGEFGEYASHNSWLIMFGDGGDSYSVTVNGVVLRDVPGDNYDLDRLGTAIRVRRVETDGGESADDVYLEVDTDGSGGTGPAVAHVLRSVSEALEDAPDDRRYDFDLTVEERDTESTGVGRDE